jgi:hypothetical protein
VDVFNADGYERQLAGLVAPTGVAVDQNGHVWVAESGDGEDADGTVHELDAAGNLLQSWPTGYFSIADIAVDSASRVYLVNGATEVYRWTATGADETFITDGATGIAVGPGDDHLYVNKRDSISEYDESGAPVIDFGSGPIANSAGIAVHGATGNVFVSNSISPRQVCVFGPLVTLPDVTTAPATAITTTGATLHGTINPDGVAASYQFEWGTDTGYGNVAPADAVDVGDGSADIPVTVDLTGLTPGTTYHYRLKGTSVDGSNFGADQTFSTPGPPRIVSVSGAGAVGSATLAASVNPKVPDTTYHFEWGTDTTYGTTTPETALGSGFDELPAMANLAGLPSGVTHHFRVVATNAHGTTISGDATFTTTAAPSVRGQFVGDVGPDSATINASINPNGAETTYRFDYGLTAAYGSVTPAAPGSVGSGRSPQIASARLTGLAPGTTYHYRVLARSAAGVSSGPDRMFTTGSRPCQGAGCGGAQQPPPAGSGTGVAPPPAAPGKTPLKVRRLTRKQIANWARIGRLRLKVTVGGEGNVTARARAKLPGRWGPSTVARDVKPTAAAGVVTLNLRLSRAARRALGDHRLRVAIVVTSTGSDDRPTLRATLRKRR